VKLHLKTSLLVAACGAFFFVVNPSHSAVLSSAAQLDDAGASSLVQQVHAAPAGARCIKWTRRWNTRHGFGHRRCVQWR